MIQEITFEEAFVVYGGQDVAGGGGTGSKPISPVTKECVSVKGTFQAKVEIAGVPIKATVTGSGYACHTTR